MITLAGILLVLKNILNFLKVLFKFFKKIFNKILAFILNILDHFGLKEKVIKLWNDTKIFLKGVVTGIIATIITVFYILLKRGKDEKNKNICTSNSRQQATKESPAEWGRIRQSNRNLGRRKSTVEGDLQCGQLSETGSQNRNTKRGISSNSGDAQGKIQSNSNTEPKTKIPGLEKTTRKRKNIADN